MKDIKDYLHLYLGCEATTDSGLIGNLITINHEASIAIIRINPEAGQTISKMYSEIKPILRKLSSMTDEEIDEVWHSHEPQDVLTMNYSDGRNVRKVSLTAERTRYLLSRGFDLFGLIDSGLAIENQS